MAFWDRVQLPGPAVPVASAPESCQSCGCRELFRQPDFHRNLGAWIIGVASLATLVLAVELPFDGDTWQAIAVNWLLIWSPMLVALVFDRVFLRRAPEVVICYRCQLIHRGLDRASAARFEVFDLETQDRFNYAEAHREAAEHKS